MKVIKEQIDKMPEAERIKLMESWTPAEEIDYLCPNGTMTLDEFRKYAHEITED